jgi:hypothetical protein
MENKQQIGGRRQKKFFAPKNVLSFFASVCDNINRKIKDLFVDYFAFFKKSTFVTVLALFGKYMKVFVYIILNIKNSKKILTNQCMTCKIRLEHYLLQTTPKSLEKSVFSNVYFCT